jgi:hypothetical protein
MTMVLDDFGVAECLRGARFMRSGCFLLVSVLRWSATRGKVNRKAHSTIALARRSTPCSLCKATRNLARTSNPNLSRTGSVQSAKYELSESRLYPKQRLTLEGQAKSRTTNMIGEDRPLFEQSRALWQIRNFGSGKGVRSQLCEAPDGPFRQLTPDTFTRPRSQLCKAPDGPFRQLTPDTFTRPSSQLCEAPDGPFRQLTPDTFIRPDARFDSDKA